MPDSTGPRALLPRRLPLVGRGVELDDLYRLFGDAEAVEPMAILKGEGGVGKSRLAETVAAEAERRGWMVVRGRAYPVETGSPFALISDAFVPLLRSLDEDALTVLTRGQVGQICRLLPALGTGPDGGLGGADPSEEQTRLFWHFSDLLNQLARRQPLFVVLEDLHWADASSIALLHFIVRQLGDTSLRVLATCNTDYREEAERLLTMERSLLSLRRLRQVPVEALSAKATRELVETVFESSEAGDSDFCDLLHGWTRGNPFFIEETLGALVESGRLQQRDGVWVGWDTHEVELPTSIRDAVTARLVGVGQDVRDVVEVLAVAGAPVEVDTVRRAAGFEMHEVEMALEDLEARGLIEALGEGPDLEVRFRHPLAREAVFRSVSRLRRRALHRSLANALEVADQRGESEREGEIAFHLVQAGVSEDDPRTVRYLAAAGRGALERHADQEAADYLERAEQILASGGPDASSSEDLTGLRRDLVRALTRTGRYEEARRIAVQLLESARTGGEVDAARALRRLGLIAFWTGQHEEAVGRFEEALALLEERQPALRARLYANIALALQELGRSEEGRAAVGRALDLATELGDTALLGRVHRGLALLCTFTGEVEAARTHASRAVLHGDEAGDSHVSFWGRWALASIEGLSAGPHGIAEPLREAREAADALRNPVFGLWVTELEVEQAYFGGDWDRALAVGEKGIRQAAVLNQRALEVRILVWTATCYLGRGDLLRGRALVERASAQAGLDEASTRKPDDIHALVPAYIGRAAVALATGEYETAVAMGEKGLALADRVGYTIWIVHRLLPLIGEAHIRLLDLGSAAKVGVRLEREGQRMKNQVALSYASTARALIAWHGGRIEEAVELLTAAAEDLEAIGFVPEAARIRRQLAGRLADVGRTEEALAELRVVHEVFGAIGARDELEKARGQFRELEARPPSKKLAEGVGELTGREAEVASLVAARKSNKAVAKAMGVSPRTVTTHLSNIYRKLDISSRGELVDMVREGRLQVEPPPASEG